MCKLNYTIHDIEANVHSSSLLSSSAHLPLIAADSNFGGGTAVVSFVLLFVFEPRSVLAGANEGFEVEGTLC